MSPSSLAPGAAARVAALAELHAARSIGELEAAASALLSRVLPAVPAALLLADDTAGSQQVRLVLGDCPLRGRQRARAADWPVPEFQRLPIPFREHALGELWVGSSLCDDVRSEVAELLVHFGTALMNLTLHAESRQATEDYCASLQALEEGIVLFQEQDPAAVIARLLSLACSMVQASAGALYVLREVGNPESGLALEQVMGMPEALLATFRGVDGHAWPDVLLGQPAHVVVREPDGSRLSPEDGPMAMLDPECVPEILAGMVVLPMRYHGVQAGICLLFNPLLDTSKPGDFLGRLQSFGTLAAALLHRLSLEAISANSQSIARELAIAETIQKRLLPDHAPPTSEYEFAWSTIAAKNIGGDYLDVMASERGDVCLACADASGHGINSALLMSSFRANYRGRAPTAAPKALAAALNSEVVHEVGPTGMFITAVLARLEHGSKRMTLCSAGHNPTMVYRAATAAIELIDSHGPPLGFVDVATYESEDLVLASGDVLLLYTDGITEAADAELDMFGEQRLQEVLVRNAGEPAAAILAAVRTALARFTGRERYDDDVSMLVVKVR